jgi:hypothetical protein
MAPARFAVYILLIASHAPMLLSATSASRHPSSPMEHALDVNYPSLAQQTSNHSAQNAISNRSYIVFRVSKVTTLIKHPKSALLALNSFMTAAHAQVVIFAFPANLGSNYQPIMINASHANSHHVKFVLKDYAKNASKAILCKMIISVINVLFLTLAAISVTNLLVKAALMDISCKGSSAKAVPFSKQTAFSAHLIDNAS